MKYYRSSCFIVFLLLQICALAQPAKLKSNDTNTPLHALQPNYPVPYLTPSEASIVQILDKIYTYLDANTFASLVNKKTGADIASLNSVDTNAILKPGDFRLTSYEWGVTYAGMLKAGEATGNKKYTEYTTKRLLFLAAVAPYFKQQLEIGRAHV